MFGFHAQQAAEKLIKAGLALNDTTYGRTHRLGEPTYRVSAPSRRLSANSSGQVLTSDGPVFCSSTSSLSARKMGLRCKIRRAYRTTTDSRHDYPVAPNRLQRNFTVSGPNQVYVSDITYLRTRRGWLYLTVILDLYSHLVVGWALSPSLSHHAVLKALRRALRWRQPAHGLIFHSDRGVQYACTGFQKELKAQGLVCSMSRKADPWAHAVAESFFSILKSELVYDTIWEGYFDAHQDLFEYLEVYYNTKRIHSSVGWTTPAQFDAMAATMAA